MVANNGGSQNDRSLNVNLHLKANFLLSVIKKIDDDDDNNNKILLILLKREKKLLFFFYYYRYFPGRIF